MRTFSLLILVLLASCGSSNADDSPESFDIQGIWKTNCHAALLGEMDVYSVSSNSFVGSNIDQTITYYTDSSCENTLEVDDTTWTGSYGTFEIVGNVTTEGGFEAYNLELVVTGKGFESVGEFTLLMPAYAESDVLYFGSEDDGNFVINFLLPYYLQ